MDISKLTVSHMLHHWATHQPDTAAFIFRNSEGRRRVLTRADVYRLASRFAAILRRHDVRRGDLVCNTLPNSPERVVSDMGIILAGAVAMNGQICLADGEDFISSLLDSRCVAVILDPLKLSGAKRVLSSLEQKVNEDGKVHFPKLPALRKIYECHWEGRGEQVSFMDMLERESDSFIADVSADDLAYVFTTSGSTGYSKLVPYTHRRIMIYARKAFVFCGFPFSETVATNDNSLLATIERGNHAPDNGKDHVHGSPHSDSETPWYQACGGERTESSTTTPRHARYVFFNGAPLGWSAGFPGAFLWYGSTRLLLDLSLGFPKDREALCWTLVSEEGCQLAFSVPLLIHRLVSRKDLWQDSGFKFKVVGLTGCPVHKSVVKEAIGTVCDVINVSYGSTDLGELTTKHFLDPDLYKDGNNGKPLPGVEVKVVDENLQEIPRGGEVLGEVLARADTALEYYLGNEEATRKTLLPDGWCRTGDVGYLDEEGDLFVLCRLSFSIMRGPVLVYPGWLESRIKTHPAVREVLVVPVPDPYLHQEVCACVVTTPEAKVTSDELQEFCEGLFLNSQEDPFTIVPRYFLFFSDLPTTVTGKPCRRSAAAEAKSRLSGDV